MRPGESAVKAVANTEIVLLMYDGKKRKDKEFKASTKFTVQQTPKVEKLATLASQVRSKLSNIVW